MWNATYELTVLHLSDCLSTPLPWVYHALKHRQNARACAKNSGDNPKSKSVRVHSMFASVPLCIGLQVELECSLNGRPKVPVRARAKRLIL